MKLYAAFLDFGAIADEYGVTTRFPQDVENQARQLVDALPDRRIDRRDIELVTTHSPKNLKTARKTPQNHVLTSPLSRILPAQNRARNRGPRPIRRAGQHVRVSLEQYCT